MDTGQSKHRLLIVDGDPKSLRVLEVSLKKAGFGVTTASNGSQAMAAMAGTAPDLIISDTDLDGTDGFELCREIKSKPEWAKIPFLFVSGRKSIEDKIRGLELGVDDYLTKPIYIKEIGIRVRTALQRAERERLESRRDTRTKFSGDLADIGVVDLVQTIDLNRKSGIIHITDRSGRRGAVFFRDGRVIDAEVGRLAGTEAMYRLFSWSEGRFEVEFKPIRRRDIIELPTAALLMEGMRRLDEWTRLLETLPGLDKVVEVDYRVLADQLAELPDEVNGLLRLCDGSRSLLAVIDDSDHPDLEALTVASNLFTQHILYVREPGGHGEAEPSGELARWLEEGNALAGEPSERIPHRPSNTTLLGIGRNAASPFAEAEAEKDVRTFTGDFALSSLDTPGPHRKPDEATPQMVPANKSNTLRMPAPAAPAPVEPKTPEAQTETAPDPSRVATPRPIAPEPELPATRPRVTGQELPHMPGVSPRKSGALSDTLRGIPIAPEPENSTQAAESTREPDASADATSTSPGTAPRSRITTVEYASGEPQAAESSEPQTDTQQETDWGGWAQGNENQGQGEPPQESPSPEPSESTSEARAEALPLSSPETPGEEEHAASSSHLRETLVLADRLQPARQRKMVPILFSMGLLAAAGLLVMQIRSGETEPATSSEEAHAVVEVPTPQPDAGTQSATAQAVVLPDAAPVLAMRADARPTARPKVLAESKRPDAQAPAEGPGTSAVVERCRKLGANSRSKPNTIFAACQAANQADANATDVMVILAQVELDRGNVSEARSWAKKAVEIKPDLAEAYVFLGGAEQEAGNATEAKAAYKKYLELAPSGRYARELRAVLNSL
jgi:CheY-like chemotaxis protein